MAATARWLERFVRDTCTRSDGGFTFHNARDDISTLDSLATVLDVLAESSQQAKAALAGVRGLRARCSADGALPEALRPSLQALVMGIESALS